MSLNLSYFQTVTRQRKSTSCLLQYANNNRNQGRFNDVIIQSADTSIPANRMVLSCYCSFFDQIFAKETNNQVNDSVVDIPDIDGKSLELLVQYIYTGQICMEIDNVFDILTAAHHLELDEVKEFCFEFLENCITLDNCITILITAKQYKDFKLRDAVYKHISDNYEAITKTPAFLNLENEELFFIVFHLKQRFHVNDEELCRSLLSWTKQDEEARERHLNRLIKFVNIKALSCNLLEDLSKESLVYNIPDYIGLLLARIELLKTKDSKILSIGGCTQTRVKKVLGTHFDTDIVYPELPFPLSFHRSLVFGSFIYCVGGKFHKYSGSDKVVKLNLTKPELKWEEVASTNHKRIDPGAAVFNDTLVVCGGWENEKYLSSSEVYDQRLNKWILISELKEGRGGNQSVTCNGCLYTMGGWDGYKVFSTMERLDALDQSWKSVSFMRTPRNRFAAVECNDVIYAIGGWNYESRGWFAFRQRKIAKNVEKYDCAADEWSFVSEMNFERCKHSACVMQGKIFVIGGWNAKLEPVKEIECYDPSTDKWEIVEKIDHELIDHSIVVV